MDANHNIEERVKEAKELLESLTCIKVKQIELLPIEAITQKTIDKRISYAYGLILFFVFLLALVLIMSIQNINSYPDSNSAIYAAVITSVILLMLFGVLLNIKDTVKKEIKQEEQKKQEKAHKYNDEIYQTYNELCKKFEDLNSIIATHLNVIARKKKQLIIVDDYGIINNEKYLQELQYFYQNIIAAEYHDYVVQALYKLYNLNNAAINNIDMTILNWLDRQIDTYISQNDTTIKYDKNMDGFEFEDFCSDIMRNAGWTIRQTPKTGDQGADILANNGNTSIVIQCKKYSSPVGNKAVQEVFAAKEFFDKGHAAVVTNNTYTSSAKSLASKNGVMLLHYDQLDELVEIIGVTV